MLFNKSFIAVSDSPEQADIAIGSYGIIMSVAMLGVMFMLGIAQGMQPIVGYNYGANIYSRVKRTFWICAAINVGIGSLITVVSVLYPAFISSMFTQSELLIAEAAHSLSIALLGFTLVGFQITATQFLQSLGIARRSLLLSISRQSLFFIPLLLVLPYRYGVDGVWYSGVIADISSGLLGLGLIIWQLRQLR